MTWTNWARTATATPVARVRPHDTAAVAAAVTDAAARGLRVKPVGSGHSFTPVAVTDGVQLDLSLLTGVVAADPATQQVRVRAGTPLHRLNADLARLGLAMQNLGDIDRQTISGALATGTHGTGARFGGLATQLVALQVVLADGTVARCSAQERPELFAAARVGLGAIGVVTEVTLQCVPAFRLHAREQPAALSAVLADLDELVDGTDHFELYWFPRTDRALTKRNTRLPADHPGRPLPRWRAWLDDELLSNGVFEATNRLCAVAPRVVPAVNAVAARALTAREYTAASHEVLVSPRRVRFREMEYAVPRAAVPDVLAELSALVERRDLAVPFPVEVRFTAPDDVWLSTAHGRESGYVAVHQYHRMDHRAYFEAFEQIASAVGGRPHWGKLHGLGAQQLGALYPRMGDFLAVRDTVDPGRVLANPYLDRVLGP